MVISPGVMGAYACECREGGAARVEAKLIQLGVGHSGPLSQAHTVGAGLAGFFLGVLAASLTPPPDWPGHQQRQPKGTSG